VATADDVFRVQRASRGRVLSSGNGAFRSRAVAGTGDPHAPEVYELVLAPGCYERAEAHGPGTSGHLTVVRGLLVVSAGQLSARLAAGDSIFFRTDRRREYRNPLSSETVAQLVITYS
jgi:quercetin dioxygenase-like cupin family protein